MTHRDPTDVILSVADVYADIACVFTDHLDRHYLGRLNVEHWSVGMNRAVKFRDAARTTASTTSTSARCRQTRSARSAGSTRGWASRSRKSSSPRCGGGGRERGEPRAQHTPGPGDVRSGPRPGPAVVRRVRRALQGMDYPLPIERVPMSRSQRRKYESPLRRQQSSRETMHRKSHRKSRATITARSRTSRSSSSISGSRSSSRSAGASRATT